MNAAIAEDLPAEELERIKAEIRRMGEEFDRTMIRMAEQQRESDRLADSTRARLEEMKAFAIKNFPSAKHFF